MTPDEMIDRLLDHAVRAGKVVDALPETKLGRQLCLILGASVATADSNRDEK